MVFLAVLLIFSSKTSKFRHSVTKKRQRQLLGDFVPQTPYRGFAPGPHWGDFRPPDTLGPLLSHILNTPLIDSFKPIYANCELVVIADGYDFTKGIGSLYNSDHG